jgi:steroid 5-alpha reductase family enzyme
MTNMDLIQLAFFVSLGANIIMFIPAFVYKTDKLTDISYALTFLVIALYGYFNSEMLLAHYLLFTAIFIWAVRLGTFLFIRINYMKKDRRFDGMREYFWKFLQFWLLQGISVFIVLVPSIFVFSNENAVVTPMVWGGLALAMTGLVLEGFADAQKFAFMKKKSNKGKWIDNGVWRMSRHPNYLGEISMWSGVYLMALPSLVGDQLWIGLVGPVYIASLLLFVSGVPLLEKSADKRWGKIKAYVAYKKDVPVLLPSPGSIKRALSK